MSDTIKKTEDTNRNVPFAVRPVTKQNIGVNTERDIVDLLSEDEGLQKLIDTSILTTFRDIGDKREFQYKMYDEMAKDVLISSALDLYADDCTEYADDGRVIWGEAASDADVSKTVNEILKSLKLDENAWGHIRSLILYGDLYLQTFRFSDGDELLGRTNVEKNADRGMLREGLNNKDARILNEDIIVNAYGDADRLESYIEAAPNPAEIFELVKRGKTTGFLKSSINQEGGQSATNTNYRFNYTDDIKIYDATKYVHIYLPDTSNRNPESVQIFRDLPKGKTVKSEDKRQEALEFNVRRGRSILFDVYKVFREWKLLEDSVLLTRVTKSSILRIIQVEVGEMGKSAVQQTLQRVKNLMEQKTSMTEGDSMKEYQSPGMIENNIYVPVRNGKGNITAETLGGDYNPGDFPDLDYFLNKVCSGLKIPKPFLNFMDDNAGFSGGESLAKVSSRYAKTIKRVQNAYIQGIKTLINIILLDRGLDPYVNRFEIKMQSPSTIEDAERIEMISDKVQLVSDMMTMLTDITDEVARLKALKALLSEYLNNEDIMQILDELIENPPEETPKSGDDENFDDFSNLDADNDMLSGSHSNRSSGPEDVTTDDTVDTEEPEGTEDTLPNPHDMDIDFTDNTNFSDEE